MAAIKLDIGNILKGMVGYFWGNDKNLEQATEPIKYVVAKSGLYEVRETEILKAVAKPQTVKGIDLDLKEGITMKTPKIPYQLYYTALKFLRTIYNRDATEATILFFWDRTKQEYFLWVPKQKNAGAASDYERDKDEEFTHMCEQHVWVMTAHSHPTFAGSFSGIDDKDEKDTRLFMVVGQILKNPQDVAIRTAVNGKYVTLGFNDVFTSPIDEIGDTPQEWVDKCSKRVTAPVTYSSGYKYGSGNYNSGYESGYYYGRGGYGYGSGQMTYEELVEDGWDYKNGVWSKNTTDELFDDIDKKYASHQYGSGSLIGMDEDLDEEYYASLNKKDKYDDEYIGDDAAIVNAIITRQADKKNTGANEFVRHLYSKKAAAAMATGKKNNKKR
jgi:hypothetical protein